ncbi:hypothetical protein BRD17_02050 [Halobacteriales archaeon SW_7_68_16]|nr:MAG: hypothetical protein BRD17_02050 [Halobacteriales archaeon SW_7_68_16]
MTRRAAREGFERFVDRAIDVTYEEFDVVAALRSDGPDAGSKAIDRLVKRPETVERTVVGPELETYRDAILDQFGIVLDVATGDGSVTDHETALLATDMYYDSLRDDLPSDYRSEVVTRLVERQAALADGVRPIVESSADGFWAAADDVFDIDEAESFVENHFRFAGPIRDHRSAFRFTGGFLPISLPTITVEFTDEAVRAMGYAEDRIVTETIEEIDRRLA